MKFSRINTILGVAFIIVVLFLATIAYLSWNSNRHQQQSEEGVQHTYEIVTQLEQVFSQSRDAQIDARNYTQSGKKEFLEAYRVAEKKLPIELNQLYEWLKEDSAQRERMDQLRNLVQQRMALGQKIIQMYERRLDKPDSVTSLQQQGREVLELTRPLVATLVRVQKEEIPKSKERANQAYEQTQWWIAVSTFASLLVLAVAFLRLKRELYQRLQNEIKLQQYEAELQAQLRQQQQQNQQLDQLNRQLMRSNDNLQQFAYAASHDLQEPLRKIQSFGTLLRDRYAQSLEPPAQNLLERIESAAGRMQNLIGDLLTYSRLTLYEGASQTIDLNEVWKNILIDFEVAIDERHAQIHLHDLPAIPGDPPQINQLFQNLFSNALKFSKPDEPPVVTIRGALTTPPPEVASGLPGEEPSYVCIEVADNGIGFDAQYSEQIFQLFQRLHGRATYAGSGIGLALCKKVVENHRGHITVHSQSQRGTTFKVYLPLNRQRV